MTYIHHTVTNLAVFARYTVYDYISARRNCSICCTMLSASYAFKQNTTASFLLQWCRKKLKCHSTYQKPGSLSRCISLCLMTKSPFCRVCGHNVCLPPMVMVVFVLLHCILHGVPQTKHEDTTTTTGGDCIMYSHKQRPKHVAAEK